MQVLRALGLLPPDDVAALESLAAEVEQYKASVQEEEEAFEDIPGAVLIKNPFILLDWKGLIGRRRCRNGRRHAWCEIGCFIMLCLMFYVVAPCSCVVTIVCCVSSVPDCSLEVRAVWLQPGSPSRMRAVSGAASAVARHTTWLCYSVV